MDFIGPGDFVVNSTRPSEIGFLMDFIGPRDVIADFIGPGRSASSAGHIRKRMGIDGMFTK